MSTGQNDRTPDQDDVAGHGLRHPGTVAPTDGGDDVAGHGLRHPGTVAPPEGEDDVEGHSIVRKL